MEKTEVIEVSIMYEKVHDLNEPKEVLEAIAKLETGMGLSDVSVIRFGTYCLWLKEHGKADWFDFLIASKDFLRAVQSGMLKEVPENMMHAPKGWVVPIPYFKGEIPRD